MKAADTIAKEITNKIAASSFKLFRDRKFRRLAELEKFDQTEQDRIFNEIVISGLALSILFFRTMMEKQKDNYFYEVETELFSAYGNILKEIGAQKKDADLFKTVIKMRVDEYQKQYIKYKKHLPSEKAVVWPFVVAIGGYDHITRGKGKPEDPLYMIFFEWIKKMFKMILKIC